MGTIVAIANQKGGVGKTTTAINLSTALAAIRKKVLLIDLDPQGNATAGLGIRIKTLNTSYSLLIGTKTLSEVILRTNIPGLSIIPSTIDLVGAEIELVQVHRRESILKKVIEPYRDMFDYIVIDCPPSMGILSLNALVSSNGILAPLQCEYYALEGLSYLLNSISKTKSLYNPNLRLFGVVLTMFDKRNSLCISIEKDIRMHLGNIVFDSIIPRNVKISEAPSHGCPVLIYDVKCSGSYSYMELAKEFLEKEQSGKWNRN